MSIHGKTIVFTGKISQPRHAFQKLVEANGGICGGDITTKTDYLVVGEKPGSKLVRAVSLGIRTISEGEFLSLLKQEDDEETPLSFAELQELKSKTVTLICSHCSRKYSQWTKLPDYETCPICQLTFHVYCPHCKGDPTFISDFGTYHCVTCGSWFKAPYSIHAKQSKHHHLFTTLKKEDTGEYRRCLCGYVIYLTKETIQLSKDRYESAPRRVEELRVQQAKMGERKRMEEEAFKIMETLTPSQIAILGGT